MGATVHRLQKRLQQIERRRFHASRKVTITIQGNLLQVSQPARSRRPRGDRGKIRMFTQAARLRMFKLFASLDWSSIPGTLFFSFTYPDECFRGGYEIERDRAEFFRKWFRERGPVPVIWRVEWKPRQSGENVGEYFPHIHCLSPGCPFTPIDHIRRWWEGSIRSTRPVQIDIAWLETYKAVANYVAKYCGKVQDLDTSCLLDIPSNSRIQGRHWGVIKRDLLPWAIRYEIVTTDIRIGDRVHQLAKRVYPKIPSTPDASYTLFSDLAGKIGKEASALDKAIRDEDT